MGDTDGHEYLTSIGWYAVTQKPALPTDQQNAITVNFYRQLTYSFFFMCALYTTSFLPYGRFYHRIGGNVAMLYSYMFVFIYLSCTSLRNPLALHIMQHKILNRSLKLNYRLNRNSKKTKNLDSSTYSQLHDPLTKWDRDPDLD